MVEAYTWPALPDLRCSSESIAPMLESRTMTDGDGVAADAPRTSGSPQPLCGPFLDELPITSASVSVFDRDGGQSTVCASGALAARLDALQLELGEGPQWEALRTAEPVLIPSLREQGGRWPTFTVAALELGVAALFAFPMFMGAATVGVVGLSSTNTGILDASQLATAIRLTRSITRPSVRWALAEARDHLTAEVPAAPAMRREVHQATGMILVQLDITATEAFARLRANAFATSRTVEEVAHSVVTRELDFRSLPR